MKFYRSIVKILITCIFCDLSISFIIDVFLKYYERFLNILIKIDKRMRLKIEDRLRKKIFRFNDLLKDKTISIRQKFLIKIFDLCINNLVNNDKKSEVRHLYLLRRNIYAFRATIYKFDKNFEIQRYNLDSIKNLTRSYQVESNYVESSYVDLD